MRKSGVLIFSLFFLHVFLFGQEQVITELEIKTSGLYYYGQGIGENEEKAKEESRHELILMVTNDIRPDGKLKPEKDFLANGIEYIFFPRGDKIKSVAYVLKTKVKEVNSSGKLQISQIYYEDKSNTNEPKISENQAEKTQKISNSSVLSKEINTPVTKKPTKAMQSIPETNSDMGIVKKLLTFNNITDLAPVLRDMSAKGLLVFGDISSMMNPENYYFVIFSRENGEIIAFLDRGSTNTRINLLNNSSVEDFSLTYKTKKIVWLQIF